jgi:hypothetical protein
MSRCSQLVRARCLLANELCDNREQAEDSDGGEDDHSDPRGELLGLLVLRLIAAGERRFLMVPFDKGLD